MGEITQLASISPRVVVARLLLGFTAFVAAVYEPSLRRRAKMTIQRSDFVT